MKNQLVLLLLFVLVSCQNEKVILTPTGTEFLQKEELAPFYHGVASGDPLNDRVILWTRVTPQHHQSVKVAWEIASDEGFENIINNGKVTTNADKDYTVKVDATGLIANTKYYYRFKALDATSVVGETRTVNDTGDGVIKLGVVSCSNYEFGYFGAYRHLGDKELDAVLHLGDYFYEYAPNTYGDESFSRKNIPPHEIISLSDYRTRYALYRLDKDLQYVHQQHPFIAIWDDHEITNNAHTTGAQNHQKDEGDYQVRKNIAKQAYYEWLPIRTNNDDALYRSFNFGDKLDLVVLDERLAGRTAPADSIEAIHDDMSMLGATQLSWLKSKMSNSQATWKVIGNQVIFSELDLSTAWGRPANLDAWDGYPTERNHLVNYFDSNNIENIILVTGDTHTSWAFEVPVSIDDYSETKHSVAIELGTTSITSGNWNENDTDENVKFGEEVLMEANPHLKYVNGRDHGYLILTLSEEEAQGDWYFMDDIQDINTNEKLTFSTKVKKGSSKLIAN